MKPGSGYTSSREVSLSVSFILALTAARAAARTATIPVVALEMHLKIPQVSSPTPLSNSIRDQNKALH